SIARSKATRVSSGRLPAAPRCAIRCHMVPRIHHSALGFQRPRGRGVRAGIGEHRMVPGKTTPRVWHAVEVECDADLADAIGSFLLDRGAPGLQTEERAGRVVVTGHFEDAGVERKVDAYLEQILDSAAAERRPVVRGWQIE